MNRLAHAESVDGHTRPAGLAVGSELPKTTLAHLTKSLKRRWKRYRKELKSCQQKFSERAIHDFRVESRRLLSLVDLLSGFVQPGTIKRIEGALKQHLDTFDDLRDMQVQLPSVRKLLRTFTAARPFYDYLARREARVLKQTRKAIKRLRIRALSKLLGRGRAEAEAKCAEGTPKQAAARLLRSVDRAFASAVRLRARVDPRQTATIHRTRVAFKKFRYMAEALAEHLSEANERTLEAMHHYQTLMGDIQDVEVLRRTLEKFLEKEPVPPGPARRLREELVRRRNWLVQAYLDHADQLDGFWPAAKARSGEGARQRFTAPPSRGAQSWVPSPDATGPGQEENQSPRLNPN